MATEEALPTVVEAPVAPSSDKPEVTAGGKKKKSIPKTKAKKPSKPRAGPAHPKYLEMIAEAITSLKERTGSSQYAIAKFIEEKHKAHLPPNFNKMLLVQLRRFSASGKLTKVKHSYKLSAPTKKIVAAVSAKSNKPVATKPKAGSSKPKAIASKPKPKSATSSKPKGKLVVKPKAKAVRAVKPKKTVAPVAKTKAAVKVSKPKPKTVAAKPSGRPAKAAKTSAKDTPGRKAIVTKKPAVAPKKSGLAKKAVAPTKKTKAVKAKK